MSHSRRNFMRIACRSVAALGATGAFGRFGAMNLMAQSTDYRALVCVFLFGGNDGNNTVVSMDQYNSYSSVRQSLAIPQSSLLPITPASGNLTFGLHPALPELQGLFNSKNLAVVANVGMLVQPTTQTQYQQATAQLPQDLFNHAMQQSQWQTSTPQDNATTGWAGRVADRLASVYPSSSGFPIACSVAGNTLMLSGQSTQAAAVNYGAPLTVAGAGGTAGAARSSAYQQILNFNSGLTLVQAASQQMSSALSVDAMVAQATASVSPLQTVFPSTLLGQQMQQVAQLMQVRAQLGMTRQIFFCSLGNCDTHASQLNNQQTNLQILSQAMSSFYQATQELGISNQVTTFTESEFGRTLLPNTTSGSDHAWGNHHFVMGGAVQGGNVYGTYPTVQVGGPDDANGQGIWIPTTSVDQYGATLARWFGLPSTAVNAVFPNLVNFPTSNIGFLG